MENLNFCEYFWMFICLLKCEHIMCFVPLDFKVSRSFAPCMRATPQAKLQAIFLTDVINYCEEQKIELFFLKKQNVTLYLKTSRNLGSNVLFGVLAIFLATLQAR